MVRLDQALTYPRDTQTRPFLQPQSSWPAGTGRRFDVLSEEREFFDV
jgi:hypothetical protein